MNYELNFYSIFFTLLGKHKTRTQEIIICIKDPYNFMDVSNYFILLNLLDLTRQMFNMN